MIVKRNWLIAQKQITAGEIDDALFPVDPEQVADAEIYGLYGAVRLRIEGANSPADVFAREAPRKFFRALLKRWPWAGYFLRLRPITQNSPLQNITDLGVFVALALCHVDDIAYIESAKGVCIRHDATQLADHIGKLRGHAAELADAAGMTPAEIKLRDVLITTSVASFFSAGNNLHQRNQRRKK